MDGHGNEYLSSIIDGLERLGNYMEKLYISKPSWAHIAKMIKNSMSVAGNFTDKHVHQKAICILEMIKFRDIHNLDL